MLIPDSVTNVVRLQTEGGVISFYLREIFHDSVLCTIVIDIDKRLTTQCLITSDKIRISFLDIFRLVSYLQENVLLRSKIVVAETFVTQDISFQLTVLEGEALPSNYGYCSINFMINLGSPSEQSSNSYVGLESVVLVKEIEYFCNSLKKLAR